MAASVQGPEPAWTVESTSDGIDWQVCWWGPGGPAVFTLDHACWLARSYQRMQDTLELTCGLAPRTWRLRNLRTGDVVPGG